MSRQTEPLLKAGDVMEILGCSRSYITDHRAALGARKLDGLLRFSRADVEAFIASCHVDQPAEEPVQSEPTPIRDGLDVSRYGPTNPLDGRPWEAPAARSGRTR